MIKCTRCAHVHVLTRHQSPGYSTHSRQHTPMGAVRPRRGAATEAQPTANLQRHGTHTPQHTQWARCGHGSPAAQPTANLQRPTPHSTPQCGHGSYQPTAPTPPMETQRGAARVPLERGARTGAERARTQEKHRFSRPGAFLESGGFAILHKTLNSSRSCLHCVQY